MWFVFDRESTSSWIIYARSRTCLLLITHLNYLLHSPRAVRFIINDENLMAIYLHISHLDDATDVLFHYWVRKVITKRPGRWPRICENLHDLYVWIIRLPLRKRRNAISLSPIKHSNLNKKAAPPSVCRSFFITNLFYFRVSWGSKGLSERSTHLRLICDHFVSPICEEGILLELGDCLPAHLNHSTFQIFRHI